jgi:DNA-binding CsgD family transcriptional regulator
LRAAPPDLALAGVLAGHQSALARGQELMLDGQRRLADAQARYAARPPGQLPEHLVRPVTDSTEIAGLAAGLMNAARRDWMVLETLRTDMPLTSDFAQPPLPAMRGRVRCRTIYPAAAMDDPAARQVIQVSAAAGLEARLLARVPVKMNLADRATGLLSITPSGAAALLVTAPAILAGLRDYFELLWDRAAPLAAPARPGPDRPTPAQQKILDLMAEGLADEAIARRAGISLATTRRHIKALMTRLNVTSRFAAGVAAHRRGWIA